MLDHKAAAEIKSRSDALQKYIDSPEQQRRLYQRTLVIIVISQVFGGAGLAAGLTVGGLLAQEMLGTDSFAGVPVALLTLGAAIAALLVGRISQYYGRRIGLAAGFIAGGIGAVGVVFAAITNSLILLLVSLLVYGAGSATNLQARYAGTDLAKPTQRAKAISFAMMSTTIGAVAGPNLVNFMGTFAASIGVPSLAGPFILAAVVFILAGLVLLALLYPDPLIVAKAIAKAQKEQEISASDSSLKAPEINNRGLIVGSTVMVLTQIVMIAIMTMTPVHMKHHGHDLGDVGLVIGIHIAAMYLPSFATGILVDRFGSTVMSYASGVTLLSAGVLAALAPADSMILLICALALLGLGWNIGLISGTSQIVESTSAATRAKTQGAVDVLIALAGASGGVMSGVVVSHSSFALLSLAGGALSLLLIPVAIWSRRNRK